MKLRDISVRPSDGRRNVRREAPGIAILFIAFGFSGWPQMLLGSDPNQPSVEFDLPPAIACRAIQKNASDSQKKLVEAEIPLSVRVGYPEEKLQGVWVKFATFGRQPEICDILPQEKLDPATEGGIKIIESQKGQTYYGYAGLNGKASVVAKANTAVRFVQREYVLPSPKMVAVTSGKSDRGAGAWFKLGRTIEHQLGKQHKLYVIFEVDRAWRCDAIKFELRGESASGGNCGEAAFFVGLYLDGDSEAKTRAGSLGLNSTLHRILEGQKRVKEIEGKFAYPLLGLGSEAERERVKVKELQKKFDEELANLRR